METNSRRSNTFPHKQGLYTNWVCELDMFCTKLVLGHSVLLKASSMEAFGLVVTFIKRLK
uniref:Uncharacterized protein n=1 Tax=Picea sitchensis TaxID=3332 RepID=D5A8Z7_PICSI|nr:unknown [Picea sitchensis]